MTGGLSRFDSDPEALAWARARVEKHLDRLDQNAALATGMSGERWKGAANASRFLRRALVGDGGCVYGAFDERLPDIAGALAGQDGPAW